MIPRVLAGSSHFPPPSKVCSMAHSLPFILPLFLPPALAVYWHSAQVWQYFFTLWKRASQCNILSDHSAVFFQPKWPPIGELRGNFSTWTLYITEYVTELLHDLQSYPKPPSPAISKSLRILLLILNELLSSWRDLYFKHAMHYVLSFLCIDGARVEVICLLVVFLLEMPFVRTCR